MKHLLVGSFCVFAGLGSLAVPGRADVIAGSLSGSATVTAISPIVAFDTISGSGEDSLLGEYTLKEQSLLTFITSTSPADFILSEGIFFEILRDGTVIHGTASGDGAISTNGSLTSDLHLEFTVGTGTPTTEKVMFTGVVVSTGPNTATISGSYSGSLSPVPEPSEMVLFGTVVAAILGYRLWRPRWVKKKGTRCRN
jgi:hypothetical protein